MGGKITSIKVCEAPLWKTLTRYFLYLLTGFLLYLVCRWVPSLKILLSLKESSIAQATRIIVYGADRNIMIVPLKSEIVASKEIKVFFYRLFKYYFDEREYVFKPCQFNIDKLTYNQIHQLHGKGATQEMVAENMTFFGKNITKIPERSCLRLLFEEVLSPFYIFQIFSFIVWYYDDYVTYGIIIIFSSCVSILLTIFATIRITRRLQKMSAYEIPIVVYRQENGRTAQKMISSTELVPGDLIEIPEAVFMPCDAVLLNGSCIMNESMLTGESIPVQKHSLPYNDVVYNPEEDKQYTLYAGTKCLQTRYFQQQAVLGLVTLTGFSTVKGDLIRTMLFPKPSDFKFYSDAFKFLSLLFIIAFIGFLVDLESFLGYTGEMSTMEVILVKASELITVAVPPALPTCLQIGITVALSRLRKKNIFCISPNRVNEAGRVNVMCFDKTGTLTEEGLDLLGVRPIFFDKNTLKLSFAKLVQNVDILNLNMPEDVRDEELLNYIQFDADLGKNSIYKKTRMFPSEQMLEIMATCHSLTTIKGKLIGDPLDLRMFKSTKWILDENDQEKYDSLVLAVIKPPQAQTVIPKDSPNASILAPTSVEIGVVRRFEFSSKLQRMSVVVRNLEESGFKVHIKGAPEKIREFCRPESIPDNFHYMLEKYSENGYRVIACATKTTKMNYMKIMTATREQIEKEFTFIGFLIMENRLKQITTEIIQVLQQADIKTVMVTGDNALTAISVARQCQIVGQNQRIFLGDVAEKKVNGKDVIQWKDFEYSEFMLNDDLVPDVEDDGKIDDFTIISPGLEKSPSKEYRNTMYCEPSGDLLTSQLSIERRRSAYHDHLLSPSKLKLSEFIKERKFSSPERREDGNEISAPFDNIVDYDDYCIAVTGKAFSLILYEVEEMKNPHYIHMLQRLLRKCLIFARMRPDEKALMIKYMKSIDENIVGMCGDGANDVGALKTANVGISLSEAEASIAAPFTSNIQNISCVPALLIESRAALSTSYQEFKFMALYSIIQFIGVTILYYNLIDFTTWAYYHVDIFIVLSLSGTMALTRPYTLLTKQMPPGRLVSVKVLTSVVGQILIQTIFQVYSFQLLRKQSWYDPEDCAENFDTADACMENTTLYFVSVFQYCTVALVFMVGKPFKKPFYTNPYFTGSWVALLVCNLLVTLNPFEWEFLFDQEQWAAEVKFPDNSWRKILLYIIIVNSAVTMVWELFIVKQIYLAWRSFRNRRKVSQQQPSGNNYQPPPMVRMSNETM